MSVSKKFFLFSLIFLSNFCVNKVYADNYDYFICPARGNIPDVVKVGQEYQTGGGKWTLGGITVSGVSQGSYIIEQPTTLVKYDLAQIKDVAPYGISCAVILTGKSGQAIQLYYGVNFQFVDWACQKLPSGDGFMCKNPGK